MAFIELKQLSLSFGDKCVLDSISYKFNDGITVLHGDSGIGKTTLLHAIAGIYTNYTGEIVLEPKNKLAYCLQEDLLFSNLTVEENMHLKYVALNKTKENEHEEILKALSMFGIESLLKNSVKNLSGGERQRLKMAMLTLTQPDIILLDEPTSKLDEENMRNTLDAIERVWKEKLLLIVSHEKLSFSKPVNEICLRGGKIE